MNYLGTAEECAELLAQVDAAFGYPRHYTQADFDSGLLRRVGGGRHVPIEELVTHSCSAVEYVDLDAEGMPTSNRRRLRVVREEDTHRPHFARHRVLRLLNRGSAAQLQDLPAINASRAETIIASRPYAAITDLTGLVPPGIVTALQTRAAESAAEDVDDWVDP